jgi:hypothetical protein
VKATEFEEKFWAVEGVRIVLRTDPNNEVGDYTYKNGADASWRDSELGQKRIEKTLAPFHTR